MNTDISSAIYGSYCTHPCMQTRLRWAANIQTGEWGRKVISVTLNVTWLLVPDELVRIFQNLLICWDLHTQPSLDFQKGRKYSDSSLDGSALLIPVIRQWPLLVFVCIYNKKPNTHPHAQTNTYLLLTILSFPNAPKQMKWHNHGSQYPFIHTGPFDYGCCRLTGCFLTHYECRGLTVFALSTRLMCLSSYSTCGNFLR